jgi:hypothetical protein
LIVSRLDILHREGFKGRTAALLSWLAHGMSARAGSPRWPVWSLLWLAILIGPVIWLLGAAFFTLVLASVIAAPFYAIILALDDHPVLGLLLFGGWLVWYRHGKRLLGWLLQGIEFSSL